MTPHLQLWLLGAWQAELDGIPLPRLPTRYARALLARLALSHPQPLTRTQLLRDLFPDTPSESAAPHLRTTIYYVRRRISALKQDEDTLWLEPSLQVETDVTEFLRAAQRQDRESLAHAVQLYDGPFLNSASDGWAAEYGEQLAQSYVHTLRRLVTLGENAAPDDVVLDAARRWVHQEPWEEAAHAALIKLLIAQGNHADAKTQLKRARSILRKEWGRPPGTELQALARLATGPSKPRQSAAIIQAQSPHRPLRPPFEFEHLPLIGREQEWEQLQAGWTQAQQGYVSSITLEGAAGVGKTKLAGELAARIRLRQGNSVIWLSANESTRNVEFGVLRAGLDGDAFEHTHLEQACLTLNELHWGILNLHLPKLAQVLPSRSVPIFTRLESGAERIRRNLALEVLVDALTRQSNVLLIVENSHLCDQETMSFLTGLEDSLRPLMMLFMRRPTSASHRANTILPLGPLPENKAREMVLETLGRAVPENLVTRITTRSQGNPLFVREIIRTLLSQNLLQWGESDSWHLATARPITLPNPLTDLLAQRLAPLSASARTLGELLAILARPADEELLNLLTPDSDLRLNAQAELLEHGVLREHDARLQFDHDWLGETLRASIKETTRRAYHHQIADALEEMETSDPSERMTHYANAGAFEKAFALAILVGERELREGRLSLLGHAIEIAERAAQEMGWEKTDARRWSLSCLRESFHSLTERGSEWKRDLDNLETLARFNKRVDWLAESGIRRGRSQREQGLMQAAEMSLRQAVEFARQAEYPLAEAKAHTQLAAVLDDRGDVHAAIVESELGARAAALAGDQELHFRAVSTMAYMLMRDGHAQEGMRILEPLMDAPILKERPSLAARGARQVGIIAMAALEYEAGLNWLRESVHRAHGTGDLQTTLICQTSLFFELSRFGLFEESRPLGLETLELARRLQAKTQVASLSMMLAYVFRNTAAAQDALVFAREAFAIAEQLGAPEYQIGAASQVAMTALVLGRRTEAQAAAKHAEKQMATLTPLTVNVHEICALVWQAIEQPQRARRAAQAAIDNVSTAGMMEIETTELLWHAAAVLEQTDGPAVAQPVRERAFAHLLDDVARLKSPQIRRSLLASTHAIRELAKLRSTGKRRLVELPLQDAPMGRALRADELVPVVWTLEIPDELPLSTTGGRRARLARLASEASEQGAHATVEALAKVLAVSERTIMRDLKALQAAGIPIETRGTAHKTNT